MILQQSPTFERKQDGNINIQCSVCFFSGFSKCHCNKNAAANSHQSPSKDIAHDDANTSSTTASCSTSTATSTSGLAAQSSKSRTSKSDQLLSVFPLLHPATISPYDNVPSLSVGKKRMGEQKEPFTLMATLLWLLYYAAEHLKHLSIHFLA